jgi:serine/threonine-protein kinase
MADTTQNDQDQDNSEAPLLKNRYRLGRILGRGGMCIVYQAWDTRLERNVAVKRLEPPLNEDPRTRARFDREGRALAQLSHPNVVTLIDRGSTETEDYLVFEYVEGRSLKEMTRNGPLSVAEAGHIAGQVAEGLAAAHLAGIIHRDVKPQNILIDRQGHAKVSDFGIATGADWTRVTRAGSIIGSARYMSPEQVRSKPVDARSDIYSLGVVMYEMLAGHPPFDGNSMPEIARQHLNSPPPPLSEIRTDLPEGLEKVVMRCLEKLPEHRFDSMDELLGALAGLGLHTLQTVPEAPSGRRLLHRRDDERRARVSAGGASFDSGSRRRDSAAEAPPDRTQARILARKRAARQRSIALAAGAALVVIVAIILFLILTGGGAPAVVGLTLDEARVLADDAGMEVQVIAQEATFDEEPGTVLAQDPVAEEEAEDGILRLTVARAPEPVRITEIKDYDPEGDNKENPDLLPKLTDGEETSGWTTELYRSATFGNIDKTGVGLEFTLEDEAFMMEVITPVEGWKGELLQNLSDGAGARLATLDGNARQLIPLREGLVSGRLWFTELAELSDGRWGVDIAELRFYR